MTEPIIMQFELARKQMISANDRLHFQQKAKITRFLRELAKYEGQNTLKDWYGLPFSKALLDGLTDAEFWTDDNYNIIKEVSFSHGGKSGTQNYKIKLEIIETNSKNE